MKRFLFFMFSISCVYSQEYKINGKITNQNNEAVSFVNVLLLKASDSTFVTGTATENSGNFQFVSINSGAYLIRTSCIGFEDSISSVLLEKDTDIGTLILNEVPESLNEVSVVLQKPRVVRDIDRMTFYVKNTSLASGNTWDILNQTPGVIVQGSSLNVQNQKATVYINDRKVHLSAAELQSLLQSYSGEHIDAVEVITKPSARYEAESGVIINIKTSKVLVAGYKGSVSGNYTQAIFPKYRWTTSHYYKNDWLNAFVGYNFNPRKEHKNDLSDVTFFEPNNTVNSFWESDFERITHSNIHNLNASFDFDLGEKSNLNITSTLLFDPNTTFKNSEFVAIYNSQQQLDSTFNTQSFLENDQHNIAFDATYKQQVGKKESQLTINTHYTDYSQKRNQEVNTRYFLPDGTLTNENNFFTKASQEISIFVGQADFTTAIGSTTLETGLRTSIIQSESGMDFFDNRNGTAVINPAFSDRFLYDETVTGGYVNIAKDWEKWKLRLGLRGEYTDMKGNSLSLLEVNEQDYFNLFPTTTVQFQINENHQVGTAYKRSVMRPRYDLLNPFRYFINENNFTSGNPKLSPGFTNRFSIEYTLKKTYVFEVYYRRSKDYIDILSLQNNPNRFLQSLSVNLDEKIGYGLDFVYSKAFFKWWYFSSYTSVFHEENTFLAVESNNQMATVETNGVFTQMYNGLTLSKDRTFSANVTFVCLSNFIAGSYVMDSYATLNVGARKTLWKNRASISLAVNDVFNTTNRELRSDYLNQDNSYFAQIETQYLQLGFVYNFGNFKLKDNSRQVENNERRRL